MAEVVWCHGCNVEFCDGGGWSFIVAVNGEGKPACWVVVRWYSGFYKGVVVVYEMLKCWSSSLVKSEV